MNDWKTKHANDSGKATQHRLSQEVQEELFDNLCRCCGVDRDDSIVRYGIAKVASVTAQVARAQALGFDPDLLVMTPDEANEALMRVAAIAVEAGKPTMVIAPDGAMLAIEST